MLKAMADITMSVLFTLLAVVFAISGLPRRHSWRWIALVPLLAAAALVVTNKSIVVAVPGGVAQPFKWLTLSLMTGCFLWSLRARNRETMS
jgi:ABC-type polysaccharide/polyol phosphate export permease